MRWSCSRRRHRDGWLTPTARFFLATSTAGRLYFSPMEGALTPELMVVTSLGTLTAAVAQWLAFLPPAFSLRRLEAGRA